MNGVNANTGKALSGIDHLKQSVRDILTTPLGSRVMRRDYGSRLFELTDRPINQSLLVDIYAATATALSRWEPRLRLNRVWADVTAPNGHLSLTLEGEYLPNGKSITLDSLVIA